ncbi:MAG: hypothetical protein Q8P67_05975 [archaeon]|nr:hypothetical protein [archaeon]
MRSLNRLTGGDGESGDWAWECDGEGAGVAVRACGKGGRKSGIWSLFRGLIRGAGPPALGLGRESKDLNNAALDSATSPSFPFSVAPSSFSSSSFKVGRAGSPSSSTPVETSSSRDAGTL